MAEIVPREVHVNNPHYDWRRPICVTIDGEYLKTHDHRLRTFKTDVEACGAAMDEVNRRKGADQPGTEP